MSDEVGQCRVRGSVRGYGLIAGRAVGAGTKQDRFSVVRVQL